MKEVYLAGKVGGKKWDLVKGISDNYKFYSSDGNGHSEHGWGYSTFSFGTLRNDVYLECEVAIGASDFMLAFIDTPTSYGSIAEIAYASGIGKEVHMILHIPGYEEEDNDIDWMQFFDAYWLVSNFSNVIPYVVNKYTDAKNLVYKLFSLESPIEYSFWCALNSNDHVSEKFHMRITPQYHVGKYRFDFAFPDTKTGIELDGHDYHKTKEQRTHDAQRDRYLTSEGWKVIRFTGSEIYKDVHKCVKEALKISDGVLL